MSNGNGVSRGDRNRNARLARLRELVPASNAIIGIDLADNKQMVVLADHDSKVLARRTFRVRAWDLGAALDWAGEQARRAGFAEATVACEPTGHRWRVLGLLAEQRGMAMVCVATGATNWARRAEDGTFDKTDDKDAVLIARLAAQLRCYEPEAADETWARLRHLGARREQLITEQISQLQQMRDLLECVWPAVLEVSRRPFLRASWLAALAVVVGRDGGDLARTRRLGAARFEQAVRREVIRAGGNKPCLRLVRGVFASLTDPLGVPTHRRGAFERVELLLADYRHTIACQRDIETRMTACELTALITVVREIPNRSATRAFGTPSAASLRISAQSSKVITPQSSSAHCSPPKLSSFRAPTTRRRAHDIEQIADHDGGLQAERRAIASFEEVAASLDRPSIATVERFNRVGGADDRSDLDVA